VVNVKGEDSGTQVLGIFKNIQRVDKFGAISSPSTLTTNRYNKALFADDSKIMNEKKSARQE